MTKRRVHLLPKTCPQPLADFIHQNGGKMGVRKVLHIGDAALNAVINGKKPIPALWLEHMGAAPPSNDAAPSPPAPEFAPWDGTMKSAVVPKRGGKKKRTIKGPSMVIDLMEMHDLNLSAAARATGVSHATMNGLLNGDTEFNEKWQRRVFAGLHGTPHTGLNGSGDELDRFSLGFTFVQLAAKNFDRVNDVAELLNGRIVFKVNTSVGWIIVYWMKNDEAPKFKRIVARDCQKITCP